MGYVDSAVKRGLEHPATVQFVKRTFQRVAHGNTMHTPHDDPKIQIPGWGITIMVITAIAFVVFMSAIEYTLKNVVATLAMVETPSAAITVSPSDESAPTDVKEGLIESGPTITLVRQKPITSSIRGTIRHLVAEAGRFSRWRGFKSLALYSLCFWLVSNIFNTIVPLVIPGRLILITGATGALLANLHAAWTHKVISMPHDKKFWSRIPSRASWKVLAFPAAVEASAKYASIYVAQGFVILFRLNRLSSEDYPSYAGKDWTSLFARMIAVFVIVLTCSLFIVLPAHVTLIRVEGSILPEDQETIVPFDRTFAGKVVPKILGGTGSIGFLDAWKSFNWEARGRIIKLYVKFFLIVTAIFIAFTHIMAFEIWAILGSKLPEILDQIKANNAVHPTVY